MQKYRPDTVSPAILLAKQSAGSQALQNQANLLRAYSQTPPPAQTFDTAQMSKEAAELGLQNILKSRELERLTDPTLAGMRQEMGSQVAKLTNMQTIQHGMDDYAQRVGIMSGYRTGLQDSVIGRAAMFDQSTEAGRQAMLRNLAIQQGYLSQTQAPIGGLDPASAIQAEMAAKAQNLASMQAYQQNVVGGAQQLGQSTTDWINQNLGDLQKLNQTEQQNKRSYEQMMLNNAMKEAEAKNAQQGQMIQTGGAVAGAAIGAAIII